MSEINNKLDEISGRMNEHMLAVKGTLELVDASVSEEDLHSLLLKAIDRMENMQTLSDELFSALKQIFEKMDKNKEGERGG